MLTLSRFFRGESSQNIVQIHREIGGETVLIIDRKPGQVLMVGDNVQITVLRVKGSQVRIGIKAPKEIAVHREEIYLRIKQGEPPKAVANTRC